MLLLFSFSASILTAGAVKAELLLGTCLAPGLLSLHKQARLCPESREDNAHYSDSFITASSPRDAWSKSHICHSKGSAVFCAYTNPSFNGGEGVSVITTEESISMISNRDTFQHEFSAQLRISSTPYREADIPSKGLGLVAKETIRAGQRIMARTPALMVNGKAVEDLGVPELGELIGQAIENLPAHHRTQVLGLSTHSNVGGDNEKAYKIFNTNAFRTGSHDSVSMFHSTFAEVSRLNHACDPNSAYYFDSTTFAQIVLAARDIQPGEELTISYTDGLQLKSTRQAKLHKDWGFQCTCSRCTANTSVIIASNERVSRVHQLWKELDNYSPGSRATPHMAEELVELYQQESMEGRIHEAYYRTAIEYIGVGDVEKASEFARLCVDHGTLFKGPGKPFVESMHKLLLDPARHPSWRFRISREYG